MQINVIRSRRKTIAIKVDAGGVTVRAPLFCTDAQIQAFVREHSAWIEKQSAAAQEAADCPKLTQEELRALAEKALALIPERVAHYAPLIGVRYGRITIRKQKTLWGSCSSKGDLNFNCLLMLAPPDVIDSVVVHELCHRKEMNHSEKFYAEVLRVFPEYRRCEKWLKENGKRLMAMAQ